MRQTTHTNPFDNPQNVLQIPMQNRCQCKYTRLHGFHIVLTGKQSVTHVSVMAAIELGPTLRQNLRTLTIHFYKQ